MVQILAFLSLAVLVGAAFYLWFQNRMLPELNSKVVPVVVLGVLGVLLTIWYSLRSEKTELRFASTVYFHKSDLLPLDEHDTRHHLYGGEQFSGPLRDFIRDRVERDKQFGLEDANARRQQADELYSDMVLLKLIDRFFWCYADWWDVRIRTQRLGDGVTSTVSANKPDPDFGSLTWEDFFIALDRDDPSASLLSSLSKLDRPAKMIVPPKTKVSFTTSKFRRSLVFTNPFERVSITTSTRGGSVGIGDYAWFLGYDNRKSEEFWSEYVEIYCEAEFQRTKSGHPEMTRHRRWVETMFGEIRYQLSDDERMERAREYRGLISQSK